MASKSENVPPDLMSLVNNVLPSDITSILKFVENGDKLPNDRISEKYVEYVSGNVQFMDLWLENECFPYISDLNIYETLHCYFKLQKFKSNLSKLEDHLRQKMIDVNEASCPTCGGRIRLNGAKTLFENLVEHEHNERKMSKNTPNINKKINENILSSNGDPLGENLKYDETIVNKFYPKNLMEYIQRIEESDIFTMRVKNDSLLTCLICESDISRVPDDLSAHINGKRHTYNLNDKSGILRVYHDSWMDAHPQYQQLQTHYLPMDDVHAKCVVCKRATRYVDFIEHINDHDIVLQLLSAIDEIHLRTSAPSEGNKYASDVERKLYPKTLIEYVQSVDNSKSFTVRLKNKSIVTCLVCDCEFSTKNLFDLITHLRGKRHRLMSQNNAAILDKFHDYWTTVDPERQIMQIDFVPVDDTTTRCINCKATVSYSELPDHLQEHVAALYTDIANDEEVTNGTTSNDVKPNNKYDAEVENQLYPKTLIKSVQDIERSYSDKSVLTVRLLNDLSFHCMLCNLIFVKKGLPTFFDHLRGQRHSKRLKNTNALEVFHEKWMSMDPMNQPRQVDFVPVSKDLTYCQKCTLSVSYLKLIEHLNDCGKFEEVPCASTNVAAHTLHSERNGITFSVNDGKPNDKYNAKVEKQLYPKTLIECVQDIERSYSDKSVLTVRLLKSRFHCMLCNYTFPLTCLPACLEHVRGERHSTKLKDPSALQAFHENWMSMNPKDQMRQADFVPISKSHTQCQKCMLSISYLKLAEHFDCEKREEVPRMSTVDNPICKYDAITEENIYKGLMNYNVTIQGTKYPIIQRLGSTYYCILCGYKIKEGLPTHVKSQFHEDLLIPKYLNKVKQFHQIWLNQPPEMQRQQVLFRKRHDKITCTVCSNFIPFTTISLRNHLESQEHESFRISASRSASTSASLNHSASTSSIASGSSNNFNAETHEVTSGVNSENNSPKHGFVTTNEPQLVESSANLETAIRDMDAAPTGGANSPKRMAMTPGELIGLYNQIVREEKSDSFVFVERDAEKLVSLGTDESRNERSRSGNPSVTDSDSSIDDEPRDAPLSTDASSSNLPERTANLRKVVGDCNKNFGGNAALLTDPSKGNSSNSTTTLGGTSKIKRNGEKFHKRDDDDSDSDSFVSFRDTSRSNSPSRQEGDAVEGTVPTDDRKNAFQFKFDMRYDQQVEDRYYPGNVIKHFVRLDNVKYPIFRVYRDAIVCMICKKHPAITSINDHIGAERHLLRLRTNNALNKLRKFHNFWMNQEVTVQLEQKNFKCVANKLRCYLCDAMMGYEEIIEHIRSAMHERFTRKPLNRNKNENDDEIERESPENFVTDLDQAATPGTSTATNENIHNIRKSIPDPKSTNIFERLPLRLNEHLTFLVDNEESVTCTCCKVTLQHEVFNIRKHLCGKNHATASKLPQDKYKYYCEICIKFFSLEETWEKHLKNEEHSLRVSNLSKLRHEHIVEHECLTCLMVIYGDGLSLKRHQQSKGAAPRKPKEKVIKLPEGVRRLFESDEKLELIANTLLLEASNETANLQRERDCCLAFVIALKKSFPMCEAYPFGSRVTGLGNKDSDLDVFLDVGSMYAGGRWQDRQQQFIIVKEVAKELRKCKDCFSHINAVPWARTPIIQVFHSGTDIDCDVSFRHGLSVENTAFIRLCVDMQPVVQKVILVLKKWSAYCSITSNLSSYALTMMIIFYLQRRGYLLSIKQLREINPKPSRIIDGWETIKYTATLQTMKDRVKTCEYNTKELLVNFFSYYASYDSNNQVICPLLGYSILKTSFDNNGAGLPEEMCNYVRKLGQPNAEQFRNLSPLCVQDPFDLSHNLTKAINEDYVKKIKTLFSLSEKHLSALT